MRSPFLIFWLLGAAAMAGAGDLGAQRAVPNGRVSGGTLSFDAHASLGDFTGATSTLTGELTGGPTLAAARGWVEAPVTTLVTGNGKRDKDLNKSMESSVYPTIRYELTGVAPRGERGDTVDVELQGRFIIHGVTREAAIPATVVFSGNAIRVRGDTPLNVKDYKVGGLTKMLGMLKMDEHIVVRVDVTFTATGTPAPAATPPASRPGTD